MRLILKYALIVILVLRPTIAPSLATPAGQPEEESSVPVLSLPQRLLKGKKLAEHKCASCHSIKQTGKSPDKAAPPFRTFAEKWPLESLEESLAEGIVTGHEKMPEFILTPPEIDAFLTFLGSLQKDQQEK